MTEEAHGALGHESANSPGAPFSEQELHRLHHEDVLGGRAIVGLMGGIFVIGLLLYSFVAWWVS